MAANKLAQLKADAKAAGWSKWIRSEADERAMLEGCWFDVAAGKHVCGFFERFLCHSKGRWAGKPFVLLPWERDGILMPLFGWQRKDGTRRYRRAGIWVPKKNGKSALASGLTLYALVADGEDGAEVYAAAVDKEQASIVHGESSRMVRASPELSRRLIVTPSRKTIGCPETNSIYKALSADVPSQEGKNASFVVVDELHAHQKSDMWTTLMYAGAMRDQPMIAAISTAGVHEPESIGYIQYDRAKKVLDGSIVDSSFFAYIREAAVDDDWTDLKVWKKANPSWGVLIRKDEFTEAQREAADSPTLENSFRRYRLNQWVQQHTRWLSMGAWAKCRGVVDADALAGKSCWAGVDLGSTSDLTALVLVFPDGDPDNNDDTYSLLPFFFLPEENIVIAEKRNAVPYTAWERDGLLTLTDGNTTNYAYVKQKIRDLAKVYNIQEVVFDPFKAEQMAGELQGEGFVMVKHSQQYPAMSEPCKAFERMMLAGKLIHDDNQIMNWMIGNVMVRHDPKDKDLIRPDRVMSKHKIDGPVAGVMALGRAMVGDTSESVYEEEGRGLVFV